MTTTRQPTPSRRSSAATHRANIPVGPSRRGDLARAAGAVLALAGLLVGLPVALGRLGGNPLPTTLPTLTQVGTALTRPDSGALLTQALLLLAWAAWAGFALAVLVEAVAQVRGRGAPRLPALAALQRPAAGLVAAVALALPTAPVTLAAPPSSTPASTALPPPAHQPSTEPTGTADHPSPATGTTRAADEPSPTVGPGHPAPGTRKVYVVRPPQHGRHETLWSIAEQHLGDPLRWHEIAALNLGRTQPDGRAMNDPHWIHPGWVLLMPDDATLSPEATPPASAAVAAPPGTAPVSPPAPQVRPSSPAPSTLPSSPAAATPPPSARARATEPIAPVHAAPPTGQDQVSLLTLLGAGLLAAGVGTVLARARVVQRRHRPTGTPMPRPALELLHAESQLRVLAEPDDRDFLDTALRSLTVLTGGAPGTPRTGDTGLPALLGARLTARALELRLAAPSPSAPAPFTATEDARTWVVDHDAALPLSPATAGTVPAPYPGLVPLGHDRDGLVLLDLLTHASVAIIGPQPQTLGVLRWAAAELAVSDLGDDPHVTLVGFGAELVPLRPERVTHADTLTPAALRGLASDLAFTQPGSAQFLLLAQPPDDEQAARLEELLADGHGRLAILVAGTWDAARTTVHVQPDGQLVVHDGGDPDAHPPTTANRLDADAAAALGGLAAAARTPPPPASDEPPIPATPGPTVTPVPRLVITEAPEPTGPTGLSPEPAEEPAAEDPPPVDELDAAVAAFLDPTDTTVPKVAVIGPVEVHAPGEIDSERVAVVTELIVFLATRPGRTVSAAALDDVVWPNRAVRLSTRNEAISRARNWLGADAEGDPYLRRGSDGTVSLGSSVLVDWDLFTALTARGLAANGEGHRDLATALRLVRGQPFAHVPPRRYGWLPETYLEQDIAAAVVDTAHRLATQRLAAGDPEGARQAARQAQLIDRYDERPWRDLLLAEHHLGNRSAIRALVDDLTTTLEADVDDDLAEETQTLIRQLASEGARSPRARS